MSEKGGEKVKTPESTISLRIILISIIAVCLGFVVVAGIIYVGVQIGRNYQASLMTDDGPIDDVTDIIGIQYETKAFTYDPGIENGDSTQGDYRELLKKVGGENDYYYIGSNDAYDKTISQIKLLSGVQTIEDFELSDNFFNSGSVILITAEKPGLSYFGINSITRDENYNIFIDTSAIDTDDTVDVKGKAILVKIENIQPKHIEITRRQE